jgi:hypothetical protein
VILEGIVNTICADGHVNISPMGPVVDEQFERIVLRPFQTSTTYQNLKRTGQGVLHVTDNVELLAQAAVGQPDPLPELIRCQQLDGWILAECCRWYAFRVTSLDDSHERTTIAADIVARGRLRDFFGFNRAKHAVIEAAILATRVALLPADEISSEFKRLAVLVEKTGGPQERRAFEFLSQYVKQKLTSPTATADECPQH